MNTSVRDVEIYDGEKLCDLERNGLKLIQNPSVFCFGTDAVLLSSFAKVKKDEKTVDLCTGSGIVPLLLYAKTEGRDFRGVEIHSGVAGMARRSAELNGLSEYVKIICGDIRSIENFVPPGTIDVVTANPPYIPNGAGITNEISEKAIARHEIMCSLDDVVRAAAVLLRRLGRFYLVHRPHRLSEIFETLNRYSFEPKILRFVHPFAEKPPELVLIRADKNGGRFLKAEPPLVIYDADGKYTAETRAIYGK